LPYFLKNEKGVVIQKIREQEEKRKLAVRVNPTTS